VRVRIVAVGTRMPAWVTTAYDDYTRRLRSSMRIDLEELPVGRGKVEEEKRFLEKLKDDYVVALDEHGKLQTTAELAKWLNVRQQEGRDLAFLIGGPDGLGPQVLLRAEWRWSLSPLTFPHAMVRVMLAEQLYRAHSVLNNHPYHRE
jgi:23S rRNA (pseudouridine1915-N3)-methyltransferase